MTRPLPKEQREKIVDACKRGLGTVEEIAEIFGVRVRSVYRYLKQHRETGDLTPLPLPGRPPILTDKNLSIIKNIVLENIDGTLQDYRDELYNKTGIDVTIITIHNACNILNLRRKKKAFLPQNRREKMYRKKERIT